MSDIQLIVRRGPSRKRKFWSQRLLIDRYKWRGVTFYYGDVPLIEIERRALKRWYVTRVMSPNPTRKRLQKELQEYYSNLHDLQADILASLF